MLRRCCRFPHIHNFPVCKKDLSATLEMTVRENRYPRTFGQRYLQNRRPNAYVNRLLETHFPAFFIPPVPYPPLRGTFPSRGRLLMRGKKAVFSFCNLCHSRLWDSRFPHICRALLRFPHQSFMPLEPYPARYARHLPHAGKAF